MAQDLSGRGKVGESVLKRFATIVGFALVLSVTFTVDRAASQDSFPTKTVKFVLPTAAGSATDTVARILANKLTKIWGQSVVVENMPGAGLNLAATYVARSAPDGYTLLVAPPPVVTVNNLLYRDMQYQPNQFVPITMLVQVPNVFIVRNGLPARSVREFIVYAKSVPGKLNYGSQGLGSTAHLTARMFEWITGVQMTHIPYRGEALVLNDILAEHIDVFFGTLSTAMPFYRSKKLKFLAVGSPERNSIVPEVPTLAESGLPGFRSTAWYALVAPPGTPAALVQRINRDVVAVLQDDEVRDSLQKIMLEPIPGNPDDAAKFIARETEQWTKVIRDAGIPIQ